MVDVGVADIRLGVSAMRVLFVEDNEVNRRVVKEMLRAGEIEMAEAESGEAGLRMVEAEDFDLILMDLRMPGMDGITAIRHIRARGDAKAAVPIIVVTADAGSTIESDCIAAGADDLLLKPVSMTALFNAIGSLIARRNPGAVMLA
jgi:CheY-like chemotaxis protein